MVSSSPSLHSSLHSASSVPHAASVSGAATPVWDPASVVGKQPPVSEETDLLIVGAGPAGLAAAIAAAGKGVHVTLIDENPIPLETMGEEVPLHFGGRMGAAVRNRNAVMERMLEASPLLGDALEAGVDVRLGAAVWGLFPRRDGAAWIDGHVAGIADDERAYLMRFRQVIVAAGRRDMGLAFDGWELPGVMGASAAARLAGIYQALDARVAILVGSSTETLQIGHLLLDSGIRIAAIVEQDESIRGDADLLARLVAQGATLATRHVVLKAVGGADGVTSATLIGIDAYGRHVPGSARTIACDTVLLGIAAIPAVELLEAAGCACAYQPDRSGHTAVIDAAQRTSLPFVLVAGDCAGVWSSKTRAPEIARREGEIAAATALRALGVPAAGGTATANDAESETETAATAVAMRASAQPGDDVVSIVPDAPHGDPATERCHWVRATVIEASGAPFVCQCEAVTAADILLVRPPRYLGWHAGDGDDVGETAEAADNAGHAGRGVGRIGDAVPTLAKLVFDGPPNPDVVKRLTRACMGPCQGRRCREQVAALLAIGAGSDPARIPLATFRSPVRPLSLRQLASVEQSAALFAHWDSWFGMTSQWVPFWQVPSRYTVAGRDQDGPVASE